MSQRPVSFEIRPHESGPGSSRVIVGGHDITEKVRSVEFRHRAGEIAILDIELPARSAGVISGEAVARLLVNGVEFSWRDADMLRQVAALAGSDDGTFRAELRNLANRLALALPGWLES